MPALGLSARSGRKSKSRSIAVAGGRVLQETDRVTIMGSAVQGRLECSGAGDHRARAGFPWQRNLASLLSWNAMARGWAASDGPSAARSDEERNEIPRSEIIDG